MTWNYNLKYQQIDTLKYKKLKRLYKKGDYKGLYHGFVPNKACVTNLLETLEIITDAVNKEKSVDLVLLDFTKAFDKVSLNSIKETLKNSKEYSES